MLLSLQVLGELMSSWYAQLDGVLLELYLDQRRELYGSEFSGMALGGGGRRGGGTCMSCSRVPLLAAHLPVSALAAYPCQPPGRRPCACRGQ